eukprot:1142873-Pelagomonas_calceolata.AAC.1
MKLGEVFKLWGRLVGALMYMHGSGQFPRRQAMWCHGKDCLQGYGLGDADSEPLGTVFFLLPNQSSPTLMLKVVPHQGLLAYAVILSAPWHLKGFEHASN